MSTQVLMPALSPTMSEGKLSKWLVKEGDVVKAGDLIAEIETDKAIMEFESSEDGTIIKLLIKEGEENIKVNEPIAVLDTSNFKSLSKDVDKNDRKNIDAIEKKNKNNENLLIKKEVSSENPIKEIDSKKRIKISPLAKRIALQNNINFNNLKAFNYTFVFLFLLSPFLYGYISISQTNKRTDFQGEKNLKIFKKNLSMNNYFKDYIKIKSISGNEWIAGNLCYQLTPRPKCIVIAGADRIRFSVLLKNNNIKFGSLNNNLFNK